MLRLSSALLCCLATPAVAQWLNHPASGIPRRPDGKPNLSAPAPTQPNGKPDLSGIWDADYSSFNNAKIGLQPEDVLLTPEGEARTKQPIGRVNPCWPPRIDRVTGEPDFPFKIVNAPEMLFLLYENKSLFRQIFLDGRQLPKDPNPTWLGYSVGRWDGDTLVVETSGFNSRRKLPGGRPNSEALHVIERYHRRDFGHMEIVFTIDDPQIYVKPWTFKEDQHLLPDTDLLEYICEENEKDMQHMVGH